MTSQPELITRRAYLTLRAMQSTGANFFVVSEAVASTAIEHPEWDMEERHTLNEWMKIDGR